MEMTCIVTTLLRTSITLYLCQEYVCDFLIVLDIIMFDTLDYVPP